MLTPIRLINLLLFTFTIHLSNAYSLTNNVAHGRLTSLKMAMPRRPQFMKRELPSFSSSATTTRSEFLSVAAATTSGLLPFLLNSQQANAFEGGVGGLGKVKPNTGVVFRDESFSSSESSGGGTISSELLAPDGTPAIVSFYAPWPLLKSSSGIESRGLSNPESSFVQVAKVPEGVVSAESLPSSFFVEVIFGQTGKFGMYGSPTDVKVKKISSSSGSSPTIFAATFITLTPGLRESERKVYISCDIVGNGVFMLVTGTTSVRFKNQDKVLREVAESFKSIAAPKSSLRSSQ